MEIKKLVTGKTIVCNLCEGYGIVEVREKGKLDTLERCMKCHATGLRNFGK